MNRKYPSKGNKASILPKKLLQKSSVGGTVAYKVQTKVNCPESKIKDINARKKKGDKQGKFLVRLQKMPLAERMWLYTRKSPFIADAYI